MHMVRMHIVLFHTTSPLESAPLSFLSRRITHLLEKFNPLIHGPTSSLRLDVFSPDDFPWVSRVRAMTS